MPVCRTRTRASKIKYTAVVAKIPLSNSNCTDCPRMKRQLSMLTSPNLIRAFSQPLCTCRNTRAEARRGGFNKGSTFANFLQTKTTTTTTRARFCEYNCLCGFSSPSHPVCNVSPSFAAASFSIGPQTLFVPLPLLPPNYTLSFLILLKRRRYVLLPFQFTAFLNERTTLCKTK